MRNSEEFLLKSEIERKRLENEKLLAPLNYNGSEIKTTNDLLSHVKMQNNVRNGVQEVKDIFDDKFLELL